MGNVVAKSYALIYNSYVFDIFKLIFDISNKQYFSK